MRSRVLFVWFVISFLTLRSIAIVNSTQQDGRKRRGLPYNKHGRAIKPVFCHDLQFKIKLTFLVFNKKICLKGKVKFGGKFFQTKFL